MFGIFFDGPNLELLDRKQPTLSIDQDVAVVSEMGNTNRVRILAPGVRITFSL